MITASCISDKPLPTVLLVGSRKDVHPRAHSCSTVLGTFYSMYSATREDDTTFIFSHFGLFLSDAASNSHK